MLDRLKYDPDRPEHYRDELDRRLDVDLWRVPGGRRRAVAPTVSRDAPSWWRGDEDASQSFLAAMGMVT